jgi:hypothetical protein
MKHKITSNLLVILTVFCIITAVVEADSATLSYTAPAVDYYLVPASGGNYALTHVAWSGATVYYGDSSLFSDVSDNGSIANYRMVENNNNDPRTVDVWAVKTGVEFERLHYLQCGQLKIYEVTLPQTGGSETIILPGGYRYTQYGSLGYASCPDWLGTPTFTHNGTQAPTVTVSAGNVTTSRSATLSVRLGNSIVGSFEIAKINIKQAGIPEAPVEPPVVPPTEPPVDPPTEPPQKSSTGGSGPSSPKSKTEPADITVNPRSVTIEAGTSVSLVASVTPSSEKNDDVKWASDDISIATVSLSGFVSGKKPGSAVVTASTTNGLTDSCVVTVIPAVFTNSPWADKEITTANEMGLIPDDMRDLDLRSPISRMEFAAVSIKTYEVLSGVAALPATNNPFIDTNDAEVLKALKAGISIGVSADRYDPYTLLNREQAATMLTRVFKKIFVKNWTIEADGLFTLPYAMPVLFADDAQISPWARDSVYFMTANEIIKGIGNNYFAPSASTSGEEAANYAIATREQALVIAVRMVNKWQDTSISLGGEKD